MPMLTKPYEPYERPAIIQNYPLGASAVHRGGLAGLTSAGLLAPLSPDAPMRFAGVAAESGDPTRGGGVAVTKSGSYVLKAAAGWTPVPADLGRLVYAASDWEAQPTATGLANPVPIGIVVALESTATGAAGVRVRIDLHVS